MNMLHNIKTYGILLTLFISSVLYAQDTNTTQFPVQLSIPAKACIYLASSENNDSLLITEGTEHELSPGSPRKTWINYSSVVEENSTNTISVSLSYGNIPAEVNVRLNVSEDAGEGSGILGKPSKPVILSYYPQAIITDIGSCYTGQGISKGHLLTYTWEFDPDYDPKDFKKDINIEICVAYTITNNE